MIRSALFIVILSCILFPACTKNWLDEKTNQSLAVPSTLKAYERLLNNTNQMNLKNGDLREVASDGHWFGPGFFTGPDLLMNAYTWSKQTQYLGVPDWNKSYRSIAICNTVLEGLKSIVPQNAAEQAIHNTLRGEALFFRAYNFFDVAQTFAPPYEASSAKSKLGIPLRLNTDVQETSVRSTVEETYNRIIQDLIDAEPLLPLIPKFKTHPSNSAVHAMLARVYLSMENYDKEKVQADTCLMKSSSLMNYNSDPEIDLNNSTPFVNSLNKEIIFYSTLILYRGDYLVDSVLYNSYDSNDMRKELFFDVYSAEAIAFQGCYGGFDLFAGLATDEVYLIRAECRARTGDKDGALSDLNYLLENRWKTGTFSPLTAVDANEALEKVLIERKKELFLRGLRWTDLRRLNRDPRFKTTMTRINVLGKDYNLSPNDPHYTFPIPDDIISLSGMQQNEGWD
jgi:hypothetical protein